MKISQGLRKDFITTILCMRDNNQVKAQDKKLIERGRAQNTLGLLWKQVSETGGKGETRVADTRTVNFVSV